MTILKGCLIRSLPAKCDVHRRYYVKDLAELCSAGEAKLPQPIPNCYYIVEELYDPRPAITVKGNKGDPDVFESPHGMAYRLATHAMLADAAKVRRYRPK